MYRLFTLNHIGTQILMDYCGAGSVQDLLKARKPRTLEENEVSASVPFTSLPALW